MFTTHNRLSGPRRARPPETKAASAARWENEGGATRAVAPALPVVGHQPGWDTPTPRQDRALDVRQDDLMAVASPDGQPPTHRLRRLEWWWLAIAVSVVVAGGLIWAALRGVAPTTLLAAAGLLFVLIAAAAPVWGAGLLRGREERLARRRARAELQSGVPHQGSPPTA